MLVTNVGDFSDEPFGIWAIGQQYFLFHRGKISIYQVVAGY
jgi:hypothetical protein